MKVFNIITRPTGSVYLHSYAIFRSNHQKAMPENLFGQSGHSAYRIILFRMLSISCKYSWKG